MNSEPVLNVSAMATD